MARFKVNKTTGDLIPLDPVTGIKGSAESEYRTGDVNISPEHIGAISTSILGIAGGVAQLDSSGKVPSSQLPSYVDDVVEGYYYNSKFWKEAAHTTEIPGETDKIYVDLSTDESYRWSGSVFVQIGGSGGHTIENSSGTTMTQRTALQFKGATVTDDSTNDRTVIEVDDPPTITYQQWQQLSPAQQASGEYFVTDWPVTPQGFDTTPTAGSTNPVTSDGIKTALNAKVPTSAVGSASGVASLDSTGKVPSSQLPSVGHTIVNSSGSNMTQRSKLQFSGMNVTDDSSNGKTVVTGQLVKKTRVEYEALSSEQKNDANTTYMITDDETAFPAREVANITISSSNWSNSTTTVDSVAYYTNEVSLATVFDSHPDIYLGALSTFPTTAEKQAYMAVDYITVDTSTAKLKCYARSKPTASFVIVVKGVTV